MRELVRDRSLSVLVRKMNQHIVVKMNPIARQVRIRSYSLIRYSVLPASHGLNLLCRSCIAASPIASVAVSGFKTPVASPFRSAGDISLVTPLHSRSILLPPVVISLVCVVNGDCNEYFFFSFLP